MTIYAEDSKLPRKKLIKSQNGDINPKRTKQ